MLAPGTITNTTIYTIKHSTKNSTKNSNHPPGPDEGQA